MTEKETTGIRVGNVGDVKLSDNSLEGFDQGIVVSDAKRVRGRRNKITGPEQVRDEKGKATSLLAKSITHFWLPLIVTLVAAYIGWRLGWS